MVTPQGTAIGHLETIFADGAYQVDEAAIEASLAQAGVTLPLAPTAERRQQILQELTLTVPETEKQAYIDLILKNHNVFRKTKNDLGRDNNFLYRIDLKSKAPVYIPQYRLADTHKQAFSKHRMWPAYETELETPVLDYRALNANSHNDRYTMHTVDECIAKIGKSGSTIFSTLDLSSGYHQMHFVQIARKNEFARFCHSIQKRCQNASRLPRPQCIGGNTNFHPRSVPTPGTG